MTSRPSRAAGSTGPQKTLGDLRAGSLINGPDNAVGFWVWRLSLLYQRRVELALGGLDLTHLQFLILVLCAWLEQTAPPVRQSDIVAASGVRAAQVSLMVKALKAKNLLNQRVSKDDVRVRHVTLTTAGIELLARATPIMGALQTELWPPGSARDELLAAVRRSVQHLEQYLVLGRP